MTIPSSLCRFYLFVTLAVRNVFFYISRKTHSVSFANVEFYIFPVLLANSATSTPATVSEI